jgi:hypothetical protein
VLELEESATPPELVEPVEVSEADAPVGLDSVAASGLPVDDVPDVDSAIAGSRQPWTSTRSRRE